MRKPTLLAESKIYPQRIPPSKLHVENASGMPTEAYEKCMLCSKSKKLKPFLTCEVFNDITAEPKVVKYVNVFFFIVVVKTKMSLVVAQLQSRMLAFF